MKRIHNDVVDRDEFVRLWIDVHLQQEDTEDVAFLCFFFGLNVQVKVVGITSRLLLIVGWWGAPPK